MLVKQHLDAPTALAAGIHSLPQVSSAFAATQAAWRFFANDRVTPFRLAEPLRELGRQGAAQSVSSYALLIHDWSKLDYDGQKSKADQVQLSNSLDHGYEQTTALLVDAATGQPLAPMEVSVLAADGQHTTAHQHVQPPVPHLDQILPTMQASRSWDLCKRLVHVIDREGDSLFHMRAWDTDGHLFVVRADDRRVQFQGSARLLSEIVHDLQEKNEFSLVRDVEVRGQSGRLYVAETPVTLHGDAFRGKGKNKRRVPGAALAVRFVVAQVRDESGTVIAEWWLLTNVPAEVNPAEIATWYYWRWRIESFHKLAKSAGLQMESWQQESAAAITKRLLVACMACVVVWQLQRQQTPVAEKVKKLLMNLSGRQTKRTRPITTPALLAGLHMFLVMLDVLAEYTPQQLREMAEIAVPQLRPSG